MKLEVHHEAPAQKPQRKHTMKNITFKLFVLVLSSLALAGGIHAAPLSAADVGDVDTFGRNVQYMGVASGGLILSPDCSAFPSPAPENCFNLSPAPATTTFSAEDICRIILPKKATKNVIYPVINIFLNYQLQNSSGVTQPSAFLFFSATLSIESDVLNNPSIIDPATGLPAGGKFILEFPYTYRDDRSMQDGDRQRLRETLVRVGNAGINRAFFINAGLTDHQVDDLFKSVITVRMSVAGSAKFVTDATITGNMRLFGD